MSSVTERFIQIDTEHVRSIGGMVSQELTRRSEILYLATQEVNQLHTLLALVNLLLERSIMVMAISSMPPSRSWWRLQQRSLHRHR